MREELLNKLNEMKSVLFNDYDSKDKIEEELRQIENNKVYLNIEIAELESKLSDDANYPAFTYMRNQARIYDYQEKIADLKQEQLEANENISRYNTRISYLDGEIEACNELLSEDQRSLEELGRQLRSLGENPDPLLEKNISDEITYHRNNITYLMNELNAFEEEKSSLVNSLNKSNEKSSNVEEEISKYTDLLEEIQKQDELDSKDLVDRVKKDQDLETLESLKSQIEVLNNRKEYLSYNFAQELDEIIADIDNDTISSDELEARLQHIKENAPDIYVNKDYRKMEEQLEENKKLQVELISAASALELKLSDETNYTPSIFEVEVMHDEISALENSISKQNSNIMGVETEIGKYERIKQSIEFDILTEQDNISDLEKKNDQLRLKNVLLSSQMTAEDSKNLSKEIAKNNKEITNIRAKIEKLQKSIVGIDLIISSNKKLKKDLESIRNKDIKDLESKKDSLNDRKTINRLALQEDKNKLERIKTQLKALEEEEKIIRYDFEENFESLIEMAKNSKTEDAIIEPTLDDAEPLTPKAALENLYNPAELYEDGQLEDMIHNNDESKEEHSNLPIPSPTPIVLPIEAEEEERDKPVPITGFKKLKNKVAEKLKDKAFVTRLKAGIMALIMALTAGIFVGRLNRNEAEKQVDEIVDTIPKDETIDNIDEEIKDAVEQYRKSNYEMALEVIRGDWGNNPERKERLEAAGYDYYAIQSIVNDMLKDQIKDNVPEKNPETENPTIEPSTPVEPEIPVTPNEPIVPEPIVPTPDVPNEQFEVTINPGDTFITNTPNGMVVVDNSNGANDNLIPEGATSDYTNSGITVDKNQDGSIIATGTPSDMENNIFGTATEEETQDYYKLLEELGIPVQERGKAR